MCRSRRPGPNQLALWTIAELIRGEANAAPLLPPATAAGQPRHHVRLIMLGRLLVTTAVRAIDRVTTWARSLATPSRGSWRIAA
jgi:hypothetical protein